MVDSKEIRKERNRKSAVRSREKKDELIYVLQNQLNDYRAQIESMRALHPTIYEEYERNSKIHLCPSAPTLYLPAKCKDVDGTDVYLFHSNLTNLGESDISSNCRQRRLHRMTILRKKRSDKAFSSSRKRNSSLANEQNNFIKTNDELLRRKLRNRMSAERSRLKKLYLIDSLTVDLCEQFVVLQDLSLLIQNSFLSPEQQLFNMNGYKNFDLLTCSTAKMDSIICNGFTPPATASIMCSNDYDSNSSSHNTDGDESTDEGTLYLSSTSTNSAINSVDEYDMNSEIDMWSWEPLLAEEIDLFDLNNDYGNEL
eukprot:gene6734-9228_t